MHQFSVTHPDSSLVEDELWLQDHEEKSSASTSFITMCFQTFDWEKEMPYAPIIWFSVWETVFKFLLHPHHYSARGSCGGKLLPPYAPGLAEMGTNNSGNLAGELKMLLSMTDTFTRDTNSVTSKLLTGQHRKPPCPGTMPTVFLEGKKKKYALSSANKLLHLDEILMPLVAHQHLNWGRKIDFFPSVRMVILTIRVAI